MLKTLLLASIILYSSAVVLEECVLPSRSSLARKIPSQGHSIFLGKKTGYILL